MNEGMKPLYTHVLIVVHHASPKLSTIASRMPHPFPFNINNHCHHGTKTNAQNNLTF